MRFIAILLIICNLLFVTCEIPVGLEPVSGVEGKITFNGQWQDDIKAAAIIALDKLDLENPTVIWLNQELMKPNILFSCCRVSII